MFLIAFLSNTLFIVVIPIYIYNCFSAIQHDALVTLSVMRLYKKLVFS